MPRRNRRWRDRDRPGNGRARPPRRATPRGSTSRIRRDEPPALPEPRPPAAEAPKRPALEPCCGNCREWLAGDQGQRGECLHPGSGVMYPYEDTPACDFFDPLRRR